MIEIEKKLNPSPEIIERIKNDATFVKVITKNDILYDYKDLSLTKNDVWLRKRNGKFELKVSRDKNVKNRALDIYDELEDESKICEFLKIKSIESENFIEIVNLRTKRERYKLGEINIDFDYATSPYDDFVYSMMEVELMVEDESDSAISLEKIKAFMNKYGIEDKPAATKIMQYCYEKKRHIYDELMQYW